MAQQDKQSNRNSEYINPYEVTPDKPFHIAFLREITDQYDAGEISYGKMVEMLNDVAMKWHNSIIGKNEPTISKMETVQTAVEWLFEKMTEQGTNPYWDMRFIQAKQMEKEQRIRDYNAGYNDAQCNHVNDAENYANEIEYLKAKIDDIDDEIKRREDKIASLLINGITDHDITDYIISPFGTPEKK